eukprot:1689861-Rhodomonas_salina.1
MPCARHRQDSAQVVAAAKGCDGLAVVDLGLRELVDGAEGVDDGFVLPDENGVHDEAAVV